MFLILYVFICQRQEVRTFIQQLQTRPITSRTLNLNLDFFCRTAVLLYCLGISIQVSTLIVLLYTKYPVLTGRYNFSTALELAAAITSICASLALTKKNSPNAVKIVWSYTALLLLMFMLINTEKLKLIALYYELFMLLSAYVLYISATSEKSKKVTKDFLIWTQFGSFCFLLGFLGLIFDIGIETRIQITNTNPSKTSKYVWLVLVGLLIKIPVIPFHYWITKVHVEASTSFSIFLSGFLVKTASAVLYAITPLITTSQQTTLTWLLVVSIITSTFMLFAEADFKRFVAIGTIQEMGLTTLLLVLTKSLNSSIAGTSLLLHSFISIIMFWMSDQIYCRLKHRSLNSTGGLWYVAPRTTVFFLIILFMVRGLPLLFRYNVEMQIFETLMSADTVLALVLIVTLAVVSNLAVIHRVFKLFFGCPNKNLMPYEVQLPEYMVPVIALTPLLYFPFL